jgi:hypothetical protein
MFHAQTLSIIPPAHLLRLPVVYHRFLRQRKRLPLAESQKQYALVRHQNSSASVRSSTFQPEVGYFWFSKLQDAVEFKDTDKIASLFLPDGYWRDLHSLSWDNRTLHKIPNIKAFLDGDGCFDSAGLTRLKLEGVPSLNQLNKGVIFQGFCPVN